MNEILWLVVVLALFCLLFVIAGFALKAKKKRELLFYVFLFIGDIACLVSLVSQSLAK